MLENELPPGLDVLWGRRERGSRGPKPGLTVERIVEAAIDVADSEGLDAVSMARVAKEVGFTTMSLYRHVRSKEELLQLMWNASAQGAEELVIEEKRWRAALKAWATIQRDMLDRHPWITEMPIATPPLAPNSLSFVERGLETLDETPLSDDDKMRVIGLLSSYTLSEARMAHDARRAGATGWDFNAVLRLLVDPDRFPRLHRMAWTDHPVPPPSERDEFLFGIERILDSVDALIRAQGRRGRAR